MKDDLRKLIDDRLFRNYHREFLKPKEFNTFDVLRYADYEIRHSNVLAWLLRPADTHGLGRRFLEWFVDHVKERLSAAGGGPLPATELTAANVVVRRELHYVDVTIFFKKEKYVIAIENKPGPALPAHFDQIRRYVKELRDEYEDHTVGGVLLTTSPDGSAESPGIAHVSWMSVHEAIGSFHENGDFHADGVEAFVSQYLNLVDRWFGPAGSEGFKTLLGAHRSILTKLRETLGKEGNDGVLDVVPEGLAGYREALLQLVKESRQNPKQLRRAVADYLKGRGCKTWPSHNPTGTHYWLAWNDQNLKETSRELAGSDEFLNWGMTFTYHDVRVTFHLYQGPQDGRGERSTLDRLNEFMQATPINREEPGKYPLKGDASGWYRVYVQELLSDDELVDLPPPESQSEVLRRLKDFMGSDESEYRRINDYFKCLAFRPDWSASTPEDSPWRRLFRGLRIGYLRGSTLPRRSRHGHP